MQQCAVGLKYCLKRWAAFELSPESWKVKDLDVVSD